MSKMLSSICPELQVLSGQNNQKHIDTMLPWLKAIGLDVVLLAILTGNLRVTVSHKTKMTIVARQACIDVCARLYKALPPEMQWSREQLQFEGDNCVRNPTIMSVDLSEVASRLHLAWIEFNGTECTVQWILPDLLHRRDVRPQVSAGFGYAQPSRLPTAHRQ